MPARLYPPDLSGLRFGRWLVIERVANTAWGQTRWLCECECGKRRVHSRGNLTGRNTQSCGCGRVYERSDPRERFERSFIPEPMSGCWLWTSTQDDRGYGLLWLDGRPIKAHRAAWIFYRGDLSPDILVCHKCDTSACVNPEHLFAGSHLDNQRDAWRKGRKQVRRGSAVSTSLTESDVRAILASHELPRVLAVRYGVSKSTIYQIKWRKTWRHVTV